MLETISDPQIGPVFASFHDVTLCDSLWIPGLAGT